MMTIERTGKTYTPKELAAKVGRPLPTVYELLRKNIIPHEQPGKGYSIVIREEDARKCFPRSFAE
jgi:excisionase family DNA binding protein